MPGVLTRNRDLKFICEKANVKVENVETPFTKTYKKGQVLNLPIAHADGNYFADSDTIKRLEDNARVVFRYSTVDGKISPEANPNGSINNIAGVINEKGNVIGMMPHPERMCEEILGGVDGKRGFRVNIERPFGLMRSLLIASLRVLRIG